MVKLPSMRNCRLALPRSRCNKAETFIESGEGRERCPEPHERGRLDLLLPFGPQSIFQISEKRIPRRFPRHLLPFHLASRYVSQNCSHSTRRPVFRNWFPFRHALVPITILSRGKFAPLHFFPEIGLFKLADDHTVCPAYLDNHTTILARDISKSQTPNCDNARNA